MDYQGVVGEIEANSANR